MSEVMLIQNNHDCIERMTSAEHLRAYSRKRYAERIDARLCWECGTPLAEDRKQKICPACWAWKSKKRKMRRDEDRLAGRCTVCHRDMTYDEQDEGIRCPECRLKFKKWEMKRYEQQHISGE